ncbi:HAD superfamily hydrolase (TIGR01509 family)/HAD superfamily hydrolase (TIGR01549 family) [Mycobacterium sp. BK086]|uniref:HAD family hydrolase n=1 Tax=Mycobacterium sp. BK086 TaxID=2512165 RepID=UPI00105B9394|nr:HAD family hydrolase [Mycobacterium sp. BK086]TDO10433.1 HAD superfamily hydrolase (TIGR01509 family)/HAD superfamily hydrolase (TIGR01549 family) [Mycobacterium sp. BK086]
MQTPRPAVLFDIDGTLVDSNYLHVHAWQRAFHEVGLPVEAWHVHRSIGMDGDTLVDELSKGADDDVQKRLKDLHTRYYEADAELLAALPGARQLLQRVADSDLQVVLATSAPENELALLRATLSCDDLVSAITSSEDVEQAKPRPDIVNVALQKAGVSAEHAVFVGDTIWDVEASARAGVPCIAVLSGGISRGELEQAGAAAVFDDTQDLCEHLDRSPIAALIGRP